MLKKGFITACILTFLSFSGISTALASSDTDSSKVILNSDDIYPLTKECIVGAAKLQNVPAQILLGLLKTEGGYIGADVRNTNGTSDLGPMQVNDSWVEKLANVHFNGNRAKARKALKNNGCYNIYIGAWIFRGYLDEAHGRYSDAVGFYHSHTEKYKLPYERQFIRNFLKLFGNNAG